MKAAPGSRARRLGGAARRRERLPRAAVRLDCSLTSLTMASMFAAVRAVFAQLHPIRVVAPVLARHIAASAAVHAFERYDKSITASGHQSVPQGRGPRCAYSASPRARPRHRPRDAALYTAQRGVRSPNCGAFSVRHSGGACPRAGRPLRNPSVIPAEAGIQSGRTWEAPGWVADGRFANLPYIFMQRSPEAGSRNPGPLKPRGCRTFG